MNTLTAIASVSVLVCSKNGGAKLVRMLQSLRTQDLPLLEIIVMDDGSTPPLSGLGSDVTVVRKEQNQGLITCRNELAGMAKGEWMVILDDDVILDDPQLLRKALTLLVSSPSNGALGFMQRQVDGKLFELQPCRRNQIEQVPVYYGWAHIIRRSAWLEAGPFAQFFGYGWEETEFSLRLLNCGYKVISDPALGVIHDVGCPSKNLAKRHFMNDRNMLMTIILRYPARTVPSWFRGTLLNCRPDSSSQMPLPLYRLALFLAVLVRIPLLLVRRHPVSLETLRAFYKLH